MGTEDAKSPVVSWGRRRLLSEASVALVLACLAFGLFGRRVPDVPDRTHLVSHAVSIDQPTTMLSHARLVSDAIDWTGGPTTASTGETVTVYVSSALPPDAGTPQSWADFIAGLEHGPELSSLTAYVATFEEMQEICGDQALGCYGSDHLLTIGEPAYGVTPDEVVRNEYGHHIAA